MSTNAIETEPLSKGERSFLMSIYKKRLSFLIRSYLVLVPMVIIASFREPRISSRVRYLYGPSYRHPQTPEKNSKALIYTVNFCLLGSIMFGAGIYIYRSRVLAIKKDVMSGLKQKIPYTITRKQYFPLTDQYFIWTDKIDNPDHEVDEATYYNSSEGDIIYIYQAARSKLVFEKDGRYEIL